MKLKAFSEWGKHHITIPFHTWEKRDWTLNKRLDFSKMWTSSFGCTRTMCKHHSPPPCHPQLHSLPRDAIASVSKHSLGSLLLHNTAAATCSRIRDFRAEASLHRVAKVMWGGAACLGSHWQQNRGRKRELAVILPKTASSRAQTPLPQICQHLVAALVPLKSKWAFVEWLLMEWKSVITPVMSMLVHKPWISMSTSLCLFFSGTKWKSSCSLTAAQHLVVKYVFIYNILYIGKDWNSIFRFYVRKKDSLKPIIWKR